jgi:hypothetical protein
VRTTQPFTRGGTISFDPESRRNAHLQVQDELRTKSGIAGQVVKRHHVWRKYADYDALLIPDVARQAAVAVILAREAIDAIKAIS